MMNKMLGGDVEAMTEEADNTVMIKIDCRKNLIINYLVC
jgi:urate oxidase